MFQIICQIGPLDIKTYGLIVGAIVALASVILLIIALTGGMRRRAVSGVLLWTLVLCVLAIIPLLTTVTIYSYGLMLAIAVIVSTVLLARHAHRSNINPDLIFDLVFWAVLSGILGGRAFYVILNLPFFLENPGEIMMIQKGGLAWQGALLVSIVVVVAYVRVKKLPSLPLLDVLVPYLALGQSIGRIGCFLNGCCYGKEWAHGIYFPVHGAYLHPTQLYLSGGYFLIFIILLLYQKRSQLPGLVFASYLMLASGLRFVVEFFRADHEVLFLGLSIFQYVCIGILTAAIVLVYVILFRHSGMNPHGPTDA